MQGYDFCQRQIVLPLCDTSNSGRFFRGNINARVLRELVGGLPLIDVCCPLSSSHGQRYEKKKLDILTAKIKLAQGPNHQEGI